MDSQARTLKTNGGKGSPERLTLGRTFGKCSAEWPTTHTETQGYVLSATSSNSIWFENGIFDFCLLSRSFSLSTERTRTPPPSIGAPQHQKSHPGAAQASTPQPCSLLRPSRKNVEYRFWYYNNSTVHQWLLVILIDEMFQHNNWASTTCGKKASQLFWRHFAQSTRQQPAVESVSRR